MKRMYVFLMLCASIVGSLNAQELNALASNSFIEKKSTSNLQFDNIDKDKLFNAYQATILVNQKIETNIDNPDEVIKVYTRGRKDTKDKYVEGIVVVVSQNTDIVDELVILQDLIITDNSIVVKTNISIASANKVGIDQPTLDKISENYHLETALLKDEIMLYIRGLEEITDFYF